MIPAEQRKPSEVLFHETIASRNGRRRRNIEALKVACDDMEKRGLDLVAAVVVKRCGGDGPAYSTAMNKGSPLGEYLRLRRMEQLTAPVKGVNIAPVSEMLRDPVLQARARNLENRAHWLQRENSAFRKLFKTMRPGLDIDRAINAGPGTNGGLNLALGADAAAGGAASPAVARAILELVTHLVRDRGGFEMYRGRLCVNRKPILGVDALGALRGASGLTRDEWVARFGSGAAPADIEAANGAHVAQPD